MDTVDRNEVRKIPLNKTTWARRAAAAMSTLFAAGAIVMPSIATTDQTQVTDSIVLARGADLTPASCTVSDGTTPAGERVGSNPVRFRYPDTPYVGARFDRCKGKVYVYYGGFKPAGATHYNIRWGTNQWEDTVTDSGRIRTFNDPGDKRPGVHTFVVQACRRGGPVGVPPGFPQPPIRGRSSCTRWSPEIQLPRR